MTDLSATLKQAYEQGTYVRLEIEEGGHEGFIVGLNARFLLLQAVYEWQDVGALIVPVERVEGCEVSEFHDDQRRILDFNSVKRTKRYAWLKLGSYAEIFQSLQVKKKFVVVSQDDEADVGQISVVNDESVDLKAVDPGGNWIDEDLDCPFDDISLIQFDDNYSRVLQRYVERAATLN
ncbi:hypothetical protein [Asticcacaulis sp. EMRT-3]|uniref:hypothetical protein n=1 Tax=Asticcacaulis sp. EMRT-3 TaxID=3040349 RepID=UPI0024AF01B8|nr:hypothetical protein [Asticcacaulis sp. EMRT-3]MDI7774392.1 hypothetical protein [Asticcacaulis sp. EMRT-3]